MAEQTRCYNGMFRKYSLQWDGIFRGNSYHVTGPDLYSRKYGKINMRILCVSVLCVFVKSEISEMGHCRSALLSPMWTTSPDVLHRLLLELIRHDCGLREKAFRTFSPVTRETTYFTLQRCILWKVLSFAAFNWNAVRKKTSFPEFET